jgi:hypothetical protein
VSASELVLHKTLYRALKGALEAYRRLIERWEAELSQ